MYNLIEVLGIAAKEIAENGYVKENRQTIKAVTKALKSNAGVEAEWKDIAHRAMGYYYQNAERNDFSNKVLSLLQKCEIDIAQLNMVVFVPYFYERGLAFKANKAIREQEQAKRLPAAPEFYPASVGTRFDFNGVVNAIRKLPYYDVIEICVNQSVLVWFTDNHGLREGQKITARATIKAFQEYNGMKNTIVNRLRVAA